MRERRTYGFVRGVSGDWHPYRDSRLYLNVLRTDLYSRSDCDVAGF